MPNGESFVTDLFNNQGVKFAIPSMDSTLSAELRWLWSAGGKPAKGVDKRKECEDEKDMLPGLEDRPPPRRPGPQERENRTAISHRWNMINTKENRVFQWGGGQLSSHLAGYSFTTHKPWPLGKPEEVHEWGW